MLHPRETIPRVLNSHYINSSTQHNLPYKTPNTSNLLLFYPLIILFIYLFLLVTSSVLYSRLSSDSRNKVATPTSSPSSYRLFFQKLFHPLPQSRRLVLLTLSLLLILTLVAQTTNIILHTLLSRPEKWWCGQNIVVYVTGSFFVYTLLFLSIVDSSPSSPNVIHAITWLVAFGLELVIFIIQLLALSTGKASHPPNRGNGILSPKNHWNIIDLVLHFLRICIFFFLFALGTYFIIPHITPCEPGTSEESSPLLPNGTSTSQNANEIQSERRINDVARPSSSPNRSWWDYVRGYSVFFPYIWPSGNRKLQLTVIVCFFLVILQRGVNVLAPYQIGVITDILSRDPTHIYMPWGEICLYIFYRLLQGNNGILGALRGILWVPVSQYAYRELSVASFEHVHSLSLDFHLGKRMGEVLNALSKGSSINTFLENITFSVVPMLVDLGVAIAFFLYAFDIYYALVVSIITFWYIYLTIRIAQWRTGIRRQMVNDERDMDAVKNDSLVSYETVKYFNAERFEFERYKNAVKKFQSTEYLVLLSLNFLNVTQGVIFMLGLCVTCFIAAWQVVNDQIMVGKFVTLLVYMAQLQGPLNFFGTFYRMIQSAMINTERMLELLRERPTVVDKPNAKPMTKCDGDIIFDDVYFNYDVRKPSLQGLSFHARPGTTTALVGESGGGKSTVFRLLFRYYNPISGRILINGEDISNFTIDSLRRNIGVVPQDTVLFNESLMYNLKYARPDATDEGVFEACRAASIHDKIISFLQGYNTRVGERGLRLSGGEKQRVAIARTILKGPKIILLDEATAALDTATEQNIQHALKTLATGRTLLIIAHRLSTIKHADQILVIKSGKVQESGTHEELLMKGGQYATMWQKQMLEEQQNQKKPVADETPVI